jgi:hypothetical protein
LTRPPVPPRRGWVRVRAREKGQSP